MSNARLESPADIRLALAPPAGQPAIELRITGSTYSEYTDGALITAIEAPKPSMALILMERRIAELQAQGYTCAPPPFRPSRRPGPLPSPLDSARAYVELLRAEGHELADVLDTQLAAVELRLPSPTSAETRALAALGEDDGYGCRLNYLVHERILGVVRDQQLYVWLSDLDLATLVDSTRYHCHASAIPELALDARALNCAHVGELRKLFHRPIATRLEALNLSCGWDTLPQLIDVLDSASALGVPLTLRLVGEVEASAPPALDDAALGRADLQHLICSVGGLELFASKLGELRSLGLRGPAGPVIAALASHDLGRLQHLAVGNLRGADTGAAATLKRLLALPVVRRLASLDLCGCPDHGDFPYRTLLDEPQRWRHLDRLLLSGHRAPEAVLAAFKAWPQVVFLSHDRSEAMGFDLATFGHCCGMD